MKLSNLLQLASIVVGGIICFIFIFRMVQYQGKIIEGATGSGKQDCDDEHYTSKINAATQTLKQKHKLCKNDDNKVLDHISDNIDQRVHTLILNHMQNPLINEKETEQPCSPEITKYIDCIQKLEWLKGFIHDNRHDLTND